MAVKLVYIVLILFIACIPSLADSTPLAGVQFLPGDASIEWKATNELKALWVYKVIPQNMSSTVISNAMTIGAFKSLNLVKTDNKNVIRFQDRKQEERVTRYLEISPSTGWMQYYDSAQPSDIAESVKGVPSAKEAESLALALLFKLGIDRSQLALSPRPTGSMGISKVGTNGEENFIGLQAQHIGLIRQIDGISFTGNGMAGGFWIEFGDNARIKQFELMWRNFVPYELREVANSKQILDFVKKGRAVYSSEGIVTKAKTFRVQSMVVEYLGALGSERQDFISPVASLSLEAETETNKVTLILTCPLLAEVEPHGNKR